MSEDKPSTFETIDSLQLQGDYESISEIAQYAIDACLNDGEAIKLSGDIIVRERADNGQD